MTYLLFDHSLGRTAGRSADFFRRFGPARQFSRYVKKATLAWTFNCTLQKLRGQVQKIEFDQEIVPLSEVRKGIAKYIKQIHGTKRPLIITQRVKAPPFLLMFENSKQCKKRYTF